MSAARSLNSVYLNSSNKPISINTRVASCGGITYVRPFVSGVYLAYATAVNGYSEAYVSYTVPPNSSYGMALVSGVPCGSPGTTWYELY